MCPLFIDGLDREDFYWYKSDPFRDFRRSVNQEEYFLLNRTYYFRSMFTSSIIRQPFRQFFLSSSITRALTHRLILPKNFDRKTFDYLTTRRLKKFNGNKEQLSARIHTNLQNLFQTTSVLNYLTKFNFMNSSIEQFSQTISIEQLNDILFFAYEHSLQLDLFTKRLLERVSPIEKSISFDLYLEFINLLVLHQQKRYDQQTKLSNQILQKLIYHLELTLTKDQIQTIPLSELSLLCSAMYRLQLPLKNADLLRSIGEHLIEDELKKSLSAVDKQNFLKILSLSNYGRRRIAEALVNRFNHSFEQHLQNHLTSFSLEIVRMTMRIAQYLSLVHFYSERFFDNCIKLIELESSSTQPSYRAKDIIQIMNTLIFFGYTRTINEKYMHLIEIYNRTNQFEEKPERLIDVLAPLASIDYFPEYLLTKLFTGENLRQLTGRESQQVEKEV